MLAHKKGVERIMKNQIGRTKKLEAEIKERSFDNSEQEYSDLREFLKKLNPERSRIIDKLFKQFKDSPKLALQQVLRNVDTGTFRQMVDVLRKKCNVNCQVTSI
jgi:hypothetical protein